MQRTITLNRATVILAAHDFELGGLLALVAIAMRKQTMKAQGGLHETTHLEALKPVGYIWILRRARWRREKEDGAPERKKAALCGRQPEVPSVVLPFNWIQIMLGPTGRVNADLPSDPYPCWLAWLALTPPNARERFRL
jgi:hypothetical protein